MIGGLGPLNPGSIPGSPIIRVNFDAGVVKMEENKEKDIM